MHLGCFELLGYLSLCVAAYAYNLTNAEAESRNDLGWTLSTDESPSIGELIA